MSINLIFKIAACRNSGIDSMPGIKAQRKRRTGISYQSCRAAFGIVLDCAIYI